MKAKDVCGCLVWGRRYVRSRGLSVCSWVRTSWKQLNSLTNALTTTLRAMTGEKGGVMLSLDRSRLLG